MNQKTRKILIAPLIVAACGTLFAVFMVLYMGTSQINGGMVFEVPAGPTLGLSSLISGCGLFLVFLSFVIYNMGLIKRLSVLWIGFFAVSMGMFIYVDYQLEDFVLRYQEIGNAIMFYLLCSSMIFLNVYLIYAVNKFAVTIHTIAVYIFAAFMVACFISLFPGTFDASLMYKVVNYLVPLNFIMNTECIFISYRQTRDKMTLSILVSLVLSIAAILIDMMLYQAHSPYATILSPLACLLFLFYQMFLWFRDINRNLISEREKEEVEKERLQNQMSTLYSQIQPHFIFNALNTIGDLCITNPEEAENAVVMFSKYLRTNISFMDGTEMVRFTEEMNNVTNYFNLEKLRFGDAVNLKTDCKVVNFDVPLLSIQPLVENCIKHGLRPKRGGGTVSVSSYEDNLNYYVLVSDDGVGFDVSVLDSKEGSVGTKNVMRRVDLYAKGRVEVKSTIGLGSTFKIILPKG